MPKPAPVTVYVVPGDPNCRATTRALTDGGIEYDAVDLTVRHTIYSDPDGPVPVVTVGAAVWRGHQPDRIALLVAITHAAAHVTPVDPMDELGCDACQ